jgi:acyl-CoA synthetase (AMP-forming)/AMP-acid ligase II
VVKREGSDLDESRLKSFALENAPAYQHPRIIWFVDDLPLASTNKLDRKVLRELAAKRLQQASAPPATGDQAEMLRR